MCARACVRGVGEKVGCELPVSSTPVQQSCMRCVQSKCHPMSLHLFKPPVKADTAGAQWCLLHFFSPTILLLLSDACSLECIIYSSTHWFWISRVNFLNENFLDIFFKFYFLCIHILSPGMSMYHVWTWYLEDAFSLAPEEIWGGHHFLHNCCYTVWVLGTEPGFSARAASVLNCRTISPAPSGIFFKWLSVVSSSLS